MTFQVDGSREISLPKDTTSSEKTLPQTTGGNTLEVGNLTQFVDTFTNGIANRFTRIFNTSLRIEGTWNLLLDKKENMIIAIIPGSNIQQYMFDVPAGGEFSVSGDVETEGDQKLYRRNVTLQFPYPSTNEFAQSQATLRILGGFKSVSATLKFAGASNIGQNSTDPDAKWESEGCFITHYSRENYSGNAALAPQCRIFIPTSFTRDIINTALNFYIAPTLKQVTLKGLNAVLIINNRANQSVGTSELILYDSFETQVYGQNQTLDNVQLTFLNCPEGMEIIIWQRYFQGNDRRTYGFPFFQKVNFSIYFEGINIISNISMEEIELQNAVDRFILYDRSLSPAAYTERNIIELGVEQDMTIRRKYDLDSGIEVNVF